MALNWSKVRRRDLANSAARVVRDEAAYLADLARAAPPPSKAELREQGRQAVASYRKPVRIIPRVVELLCGKCNHRGEVKLMPHIRIVRFRCSKCGAQIVMS